jgi:hypothetical protein
MTRIPIIAFLVIAAALLAETRAGNAQSPYSYPWCAVYGGGSSGGAGGAMSCYYTTWDECRATMSGIGGLCVASPYYHAQATPLPRHSTLKQRYRRHARTAQVSISERLE